MITIEYTNWSGARGKHVLLGEEEFAKNGTVCPLDKTSLLTLRREQGDSTIYCPNCGEEYSPYNQPEIEQELLSKTDYTRRRLAEIRKEEQRLQKLLELAQNPIQQTTGKKLEFKMQFPGHQEPQGQI